MARTATPKVRRLLAEGRVQPAGTAAIHRVIGDHGLYDVVLGDDFSYCLRVTAEGGRAPCPSHGGCAHIAAARLVQDALVDGIAATVNTCAA